MSLDEKIRELDEHVSGRVKQWLREQHDLLGRKLGEEITRQLDEAGSRLPENLISDEELAELAAAEAPVPEAAPTGNLSALREGRRHGRQARTQAAALSALLSEGKGFASRLAVFLIRSGEAVGWKSEGFGDAGDALASLTLDFQDGGPGTGSRKAEPSVRMSAADCGRIWQPDREPIAPRWGADPSRPP